MTRLADEERLDWLRLIRSERIGPRTFRALLAQFGSAGEALRALPDLARKAGRGTVKVASRADALREMERSGRLGIRLVASSEEDYPVPLRAVDSAPPLLAVRGSIDALSQPCVAIVGSRNASAAGGAFAERLAAAFGEARFTVVSGLARGIDTRAHRAALATGRTVAVLAGGHDRVYPAENAPLLDRMVEAGGAAVTEMPLAWEPRAQDFPRRNRIVSGLCYAVVVVEAARRSGSLITARLATEQGRDVFAVPGSPLDPRAEGTNDLIRAGATLCGSPDHVIAAVAPLLGDPAGSHRADALREPHSAPFGLGEGPFWDELDADADQDERDVNPDPGSAQRSERDLLRALIGPSPVRIDDLARQSGLPVRTVQAVLVELELGGSLVRHGGDLVSAHVRGAL